MRRRISSKPLVFVLATMLIVAIVGPVNLAQNDVGSKQANRDYFVLYRNLNGETVCRDASPDERKGLEQANPSGLHRINHLVADDPLMANAVVGAADLPAHLTIVLRATSQLESFPDAKAAFIRAAQTWESKISSPVTIYIDVDFGSTNFGQPWAINILGSTSAPSINGGVYQSVRNNLIAGASNGTETSIYNSLPATTVPTDLGDASTVSVSSSIARAIGLLDPTAQPTDSAARIGFNSNPMTPYDFDRSNGLSGTDFEAVATHEIGHALGFTSRAGSGSSTPAIWDIFRFRTGTNAGTFTTAQRIMTIGGSPDPLQFFFVPGNPELGLSTGGPSGVSTNGGDGWQSSHWKHTSGCTTASYIGIMDPAIPPNCRRDITSNDTNALNIFGYNLDNNNPPPPLPPPPPAPANDTFANAQVVTGCLGSTTGTNIGATHELGEPSHDSANPPNAGAASVWYQWQAPSSGSVTITTAGSNYDTMLGVYTGTAVNALTEIQKNDDVNTQAGIVTSSVTFMAIAGRTYRIAVDGWGGDLGNIKLNWSADCGPLSILIQDNVSEAVALDSVTFVKGPFSLTDNYNFSGDRRTRIILFTSDLGFTQPQSNPSTVSVQIGGMPATVENAGPFNAVAGTSYLVVRLPDGLSTGQTYAVIVTLGSVSSSNAPTIAIQ